MNLEDRVERLEHTTELLAMYIPRLTENLQKHYSLSNRLREEIFGDFRTLQSVLSNILDDLQVHYKSHSEEIKRKVDASKRRTTDTNKLNTI